MQIQKNCILHHMTKRLVKSTSLVSVLTMCSRVLGFARDMLLAQLFGAVAGFDAFIVAFKIPNFTRRLFAEGAFSQAFVPVLSEYRQTRSPKTAKAFISHMFSALATALLLFLVIAEVLAPFLIMIFAPGFVKDPARFMMAQDMLQITLPYVVLIALTAFSGAVMNCYGQFGVPAFTPVLLNVALIAAALWLAPLLDVSVNALAWGVFVGGIAQLLFQIPFLHKRGLLPHPKWAWRDKGVQRVLKLMVPALFGVSVAQFGLLIDTLFASFLKVGSISWLYYSERLTFFPLGVFGVALATVVLPHLSRKFASKNKRAFSASLDWALRCVCVVGIPAAIGLLLLAGPLLTTLFGYGEFTQVDVAMAQRSLVAFSIGVPFFMLIKILVAGFYSRQEIKTPVRIAAFALASNIVLNLILIKPLAHAGLALATSLSSIVNAGFLFYRLRKQDIYRPNVGWLTFILRLVLGNSAMVLFLLFCVPALAWWFNALWYQRASYLFVDILGAVLIYFSSLWLSGLRISHFNLSSKV